VNLILEIFIHANFKLSANPSDLKFAIGHLFLLQFTASSHPEIPAAN
jgi:hypothetical protein